MSRRRATLLAGAAVFCAAAVPSLAAGAVTALRLDNQTTPVGCADVGPATTTLVGSFKLAGATVGQVVPSPVVLTACAGGAGRSISFDAMQGGLIEGLDLEMRGNDEATSFTTHMPISRRDGTVVHLRELPAGASVNGTPAGGPSFDLTPVPGALAVTSTAGVVAVTARPGLSKSTSFYVTTDGAKTSVQLNDPMPRVDVLVEMRRADTSLAFSRTVPPDTFINDGPPLGPGASVRVRQAGLVDRTRQIGTAELRSDGFRVALPPGADSGRYSSTLSLHAVSTSSTDPLGPCRTLQAAGILPSECVGLTTPRTEVTATGLVPVAGDQVNVTSNWTGSVDFTEIRVAQPGVYFHAGSGEMFALGITGGPLLGTLTVPRPAPAGPLALTRAGLAANASGEGSNGRYPFPAKVLPDSTVTFTGGSAPLQATLTLDAAINGNTLQGRTRPAARVRVRLTSGFFTLLDAAVTAGADGAFSAPLGSPPSGSRIEIGAGDPGTRGYTSRTLVTGRPQIQIQGAADQQLVRGTVNLTAANATPATGWSVDEQAEPRIGGAALALNTTLRRDGPLRVDVADAFTIEDYLYLVVDNTAPSGGAGADQRVRVGRDAAFVTSAADANGIASVQVAFGDGATVTQTGAGIGAPLLHRYTRPGSFTARATITDKAGNVTVDEAIITVTAAPVLRLTGKTPTSVVRGKVLKISQRTSVAGTLRVQLLASTGKAVRKGSRTTTRANGRATINLKTKGLKKGRYLLVRQLVGADGEAGPVLVTAVRVR